MTGEVKIHLTAMGTGTVELDGREIQNVLAGFTLNANAGEATSMLVRLTPVALRYVGTVDVKLPESVRVLLVAAGWTPPAESVDGDPSDRCCSDAACRCESGECAC